MDIQYKNVNCVHVDDFEDQDEGVMAGCVSRAGRSKFHLPLWAFVIIQIKRSVASVHHEAVA